MFKPLSRRRALRGLGVTMALPLLESMAKPSADNQLKKPPTRAAFIFMPNGVVPKDWDLPEDGDANTCSSPFLSHLKPVKDDFILLENLWHEQTQGRNGHWPKVPAFLSGGFVVKSKGRDIDTGHVSVDQLMAKLIGHKTVLRSLELGVDRPRSDVDNAGGGFAKIYGNHVAWKNRYTPVPSERVPLMAFNRLFRSGPAPKIPGLDPRGHKIKQTMVYDTVSILDLVRDDAKSIHRTISANDRDKLDEYFDSVRAVERQIQNSIVPQKRWVNSTKFEFTKPEGGVPRDREKHIRLMMDVMLLAFWTDSTRIATLMLGNAQSDLRYSFLPGVTGSYHELSHHRNEADALREYKEIIHFHMRQVAYLLEKMKAMNENGTSLLDNSMVMFGSSIKDGNAHSEENLPLLLAGKGGGAIRSGRRLKSAPDTPLCNLYLSMLDLMGAPQASFGDSTGKLKLT